MLVQRTKGIQSLQTALQALLSFLLFWAWFSFFTLTYSAVDSSMVADYLLNSVWLVSAFALEHLLRGGHGEFSSHNFIGSHRQALRQSIFIIGVMLFFLFATKDQTVSRMFLLTFIPMQYGLLLVTNRKLPRLLARRFLGGAYQQRTVLLGSTDRLHSMVNWAEQKKDYGLNIIGVLTPRDDRWGPDLPWPVLATMESFESVISDQKVHQVILAEDSLQRGTTEKIINACEKRGIRLLMLSDSALRFRHSVCFIQDEGFWFIGLRQEPLEDPFNRVLKRGFDIAVSLPVVVLILPVVGTIVWALQRMRAPGPLMFVQERAGLLNIPFRIYKFRTMHLNPEASTRQAVPGDSRIYKGGEFLRKYSVDELPQFINVLIGNMSVVGPRPHMISQSDSFEKIMETYHVRALVKPGITGLAQVRGYRGQTRNHEDLINRVKSDIDYIENWSFSRDVLIVARTIAQLIFPPRSAH